MGREIRKRLEKTCSDLTRKQKAPHPWGFLLEKWWLDLSVLKLISWNIAGRLSAVNQQIDYLLDGNFDIICLQEVISKSQDIITNRLKNFDYNYLSPVSITQLSSTGKHKYNLLILSKAKINNNKPSYEINWQEKYVSGILTYDSKKLEITTMHVPPGSSNGIQKIISIEQFYNNIIASKSKYRIVCGDWNTPKREYDNGEIETWKKTGARIGEGERWDNGERLLLEKLRSIGIRDSYRHLNGYNMQEYSWYVNTKGGLKGRRYDHIHSSETINVKSCYYDHAVRENKLSDHSAIISEFDIN